MRLEGVMEDPVDSGSRCDNLNLGEVNYGQEKFL